MRDSHKTNTYIVIAVSICRNALTTSNKKLFGILYRLSSVVGCQKLKTLTANVKGLKCGNDLKYRTISSVNNNNITIYRRK